MKCQHCAEDIQEEAKICKHCGKPVSSKIEMAVWNFSKGCFQVFFAVSLVYILFLVFVGFSAK